MLLSKVTHNTSTYLICSHALFPIPGNYAPLISMIILVARLFSDVFAMVICNCLQFSQTILLQNFLVLLHLNITTKALFDLQF